MSLLRLKGIHCLNESDGTDADQILRLFLFDIIFLYDVSNQTQIVFNQLVSGFLIALTQQGDTARLLRLVQRLLKGIAADVAHIA